MFALMTTYIYSEMGDNPNALAKKCGLSEGDGQKIRDIILSSDFKINVGQDIDGLACGMDNKRIKIDEDGLITAKRWEFSSGTRAWAFGDTIHMCEFYRIEAALADYYLWWALRLYSYSLNVSHSWWDWFMGQLCAKAAMGEIVRMAAGILHEMGHLTDKGGVSYHCFSLGYEDSNEDEESFLEKLLLECNHSRDQEDELHYCCHSVLQIFFKERVKAALALPIGTMETDGFGDAEGSSDGMFIMGIGENIITKEYLHNSCCEEGSNVEANRSSIWTLNSALTLEWDVRYECTGGSSDGSGRIYYNQS